MTRASTMGRDTRLRFILMQNKETFSIIGLELGAAAGISFAAVTNCTWFAGKKPDFLLLK
jgi:hypothetical protein